MSTTNLQQGTLSWSDERFPFSKARGQSCSYVLGNFSSQELGNPFLVCCSSDDNPMLLIKGMFFFSCGQKESFGRLWPAQQILFCIMMMVIGDMGDHKLSLVLLNAGCFLSCWPGTGPRGLPSDHRQFYSLLVVFCKRCAMDQASLVRSALSNVTISFYESFLFVMENFRILFCFV